MKRIYEQDPWLMPYKDAIDAHDAERLHELLAEGDRRKREIEGR